MERRDSIFDERVLWSARPKVVTVPAVYRASAIVCGIIAFVTLASAVMVATALGAPVGKMIVFTVWMVTLAFALYFVPRWWRAEFEYTLTDRNIVMRRGKYRRSIETKSISYARIHWHPTQPGIGDLELVRAVPTGALRRKLSIVLTGLVAPDRVWAILRGVQPSTGTGDGLRPLAQRLDIGERVLWAAHPVSRWRRWVPAGRRRLVSMGIALGMVGIALVVALRAAASVHSLVAAGLPPGSGAFVALVASVALTVALLVGGAGAIVYDTLVRPARLATQTRYLITDRRVLIQRGHVELHLERERIVDVIEAPAESGYRDLFLVLDGPRAKALASSGAFGEEPGQGLQPVLHMIPDTDDVAKLLKTDPPPALPLAA
jgi:hypothetical protein